MAANYLSRNYFQEMKPFLLLLILNLMALAASAQIDYVLLQKRDRTIQRYYAGYNIDVYTKQDQYISGIVDKCRNDSIFIKVGSKEVIPTGFGGGRVEWVTKGYIGIHINDIAIIPKKSRLTWASVGNMALKVVVLAGCIWGVNSIHTDYKAAYVIGYTGTILTSVLISQVNIFHNRKPAGYHIGKKFKLKYVNLTNKAPMPAAGSAADQ